MRCPYKYKYELVDWIVTIFNISKSKANKLNKDQLYAIWYKRR